LLKLKLSCDWRSVSQSVLMSGSRLELMTRFIFVSDSCGFHDVGHPLWQVDGSVIYLYHYFWAFPEQSLSGQSRVELRTIFYCLIRDSSNL
jgi:hypothetical protein